MKRFLKTQKLKKKAIVNKKKSDKKRKSSSSSSESVTPQTSLKNTNLQTGRIQTQELIVGYLRNNQMSEIDFDLLIQKDQTIRQKWQNFKGVSYDIRFEDIRASLLC